MEKDIFPTGFQALGFKTYRDFLESELWREKRDWILSQITKCELCGSKKQLCVHHKHYNTLGNESRKDILVLCFKCHKKIHEDKR